MQVGTLPLQLIFDKDVLYEVPLYQRPYVWEEEEQWGPLWEDVRRLADALVRGEKPRPFSWSFGSGVGRITAWDNREAAAD